MSKKQFTLSIIIMVCVFVAFCFYWALGYQDADYVVTVTTCDSSKTYYTGHLPQTSGGFLVLRDTNNIRYRFGSDATIKIEAK